MAKEPIPSNFLTDTIRFVLRWGLRLIILLVALFALILAGVFAYQKYDTWKNELVILVALKCGPTNVKPKDWPKSRFISLRGSRKSKVISKSVLMMSKSDITKEIYSGWNEKYGFEFDPNNLTTTRDEYVFEKEYDDGKKTKTAFNRKSLQRIITRTKDGVQTEQSFRECKEISVKDYKAELKSVEKAFSEGNKI